MTDRTTESAAKPAPAKPMSACAASTPTTALDARYGQIGISAVAAAVRYQGAAKNPAYAPARAYWHDRAGEAA